MDKLKIKIILASIRNGRFGKYPADWITELAQNTEGLSVELLDLKDFSLPTFSSGTSPMYVKGEYELPEVNEWAKKIDEADGFIIVTPEYNHGYPSQLKNNIDHLYKEWIRKPICFVSYGSTGGARVIQQLREVAIELQMVPIRNSVHIFSPWNLVDDNGDLKPGVFDSSKKAAEKTIEELIWWAKAIKEAKK